METETLPKQRKRHDKEVLSHLPRILYDTKEAAYLLDVSERAVYNRIASGELRSIKIGPRRKIPAEAIKAFIDRKLAEA